MKPLIKYAESASLLLILLAVLCGCGRSVDRSVVDPYEVLREKLQQTVTVDWDDVPLEKALQELAQQAGVAVRVDLEWLAKANVSPDEPVTLHVHDVRLRSALHLTLDDIGLGCIFADGEIIATSREVSDSTLVNRPHFVADITREQGSFDEQRLADVIKRTVCPELWESPTGGLGKIEVKPGALFIEQRFDIHGQIEDLLADLRLPRDANDAALRAERSPSIAAIRKALETRVTIDLSRSPAQIVRAIADEHGLNVLVRRRKLEEHYLLDAFNASVPAADAAPSVLTDIPLCTALDLCLEPLSLNWSVRDDVLLITITSRGEAEARLPARCYAIPPRIGRRPLYSTPNVYGHGSVGYGHVVSELDQCLAPLVDWDSYIAIPHHVVVSQTERGHHELANWLVQFRQAADPSVLDYDERATSPQAARLWQALDQPVTIDLDGSAYIGKGIKDFLARHGVRNVVIDEEAKVHLDGRSPVLHVKDIPLADALDLLLEPHGLGWYARDNVLVVTSKDAASATMVHLAYRCPCLANGRTDSMVELVMKHVEHDSWTDAGGPGTGEFVLGNVFLVSQSWPVHRQLRAFLRQWQAAAGATSPASFFAGLPADSRLLDDERVVTGFYPLPDEIVRTLNSAITQQQGDGRDFAKDCLSELLTELCEPDDSFGLHRMQIVGSRRHGSLVLVVSDTLPVHRKVRQVLDEAQRGRRTRDEMRRQLQEVQKSLRQKRGTQVMPNAGGGQSFFSVNSERGSTPCP